MLLDILDKIYNNKLVMKVFLIVVIVLVITFLVIFLIGCIEKKRRLHPKVKKDDELKDISFDKIKEDDLVKEDVTFEMPSLTKNLEDFKKSIEEEIESNNKENVRIIETRVKTKPVQDKQKTYKIEGSKEVEDTSIFEITEE